MLHYYHYKGKKHITFQSYGDFVNKFNHFTELEVLDFMEKCTNIVYFKGWSAQCTLHNSNLGWKQSDGIFVMMPKEPHLWIKSHCYETPYFDIVIAGSSAYYFVVPKTILGVWFYNTFKDNSC